MVYRRVSPNRLFAVWVQPPNTLMSPEQQVISPGADPTLTQDAQRLLFMDSFVVYESTGTPPDIWSDRVAIIPGNASDPAVSPDGRLVIYVVDEGASVFALWMIQRRELHLPFEAPIRLPTAINMTAITRDPHITTSGDLLFGRHQNGVPERRIAIAQGRRR